MISDIINSYLTLCEKCIIFTAPASCIMQHPHYFEFRNLEIILRIESNRDISVTLLLSFFYSRINNKHYREQLCDIQVMLLLSFFYSKINNQHYSEQT